MEEVVYTKITEELCMRIDELKNCIKRGGVIRQDDIIEGINVVKNIVINLNPSTLDNLYEIINMNVIKYKRNYSKDYKILNVYSQIGMNNALSLIYNFILNNKTFEKCLVKEKKAY